MSKHNHHLLDYYLTGTPQYESGNKGAVLPPFLFTLHVSDFQVSSSSHHLHNTAGSAVVGCVSDGPEEECSGWFCVVVSEESASEYVDQEGRGQDVDAMEMHEALSIHIDNKLNCYHHKLDHLLHH